MSNVHKYIHFHIFLIIKHVIVLYAICNTWVFIALTNIGLLHLFRQSIKLYYISDMLDFVYIS